MTRKITLAVLVVCSFALTAVVAQASTISLPIANGDFEAAPTPPIYQLWAGVGNEYANYTGTVPPSWTMLALDGGVYTGSSLNSQTQGSSSPGPYFRDNWNPDTRGLSGSRYAYILNGAASHAIWQQLKNPDNTAFTFATAGDVLTVDLWQYNSKLDIQLYSGATPATATRIDSVAPFTFSGTAWQPDTFSHIATTPDLTATSLWLRLGWNSTGTAAQILVDDVTASYTAIVPEPSTLVLLAAGLVGLLAYAWRKRRSM